MLPPPPRSTLFPTRRSSDLPEAGGRSGRYRNTHTHRHEAGIDRMRKPAKYSASNQFRRGESIHRDRKSTRLNSSHVAISYAVFCLKKKKDTKIHLYSKFTSK